MVVTVPHVQSFGTLVDTPTASNVDTCHSYINFCSVTLLASKGKGKVHPRTGHEGPEWSRCIALLFLQPRC